MTARRRSALTGLAALAAGAALGAGLEEFLYRRIFRRADPEAGEPIGSVPGETSWVESFDGTRLRVRSYGAADAPLTLVLAHGIFESHLVWHYQVRDLVEDGTYRLVAYDARGHGSSGAVRGPDGATPFTGYTLARDLVGVIEQTAPGRVVLVGHSLGGMTIQALWHHGLVDQVRDRIAGAVLVNTTYTTDLRSWRGGGTKRERAYERVEDVVQHIPLGPAVVRRLRPRRGADLTLLVARLVYGRDPSPHHIATTVRMYEGTPSETIAAAVDISRFDAYPSLPQVDVPTLVVAGSKDLVTPQWLSEAIALHVPGAELVVLEGCGHLAPFERYDELNRHLRKFCEAF